MIAVDTSALLAIIQAEPEGVGYLQARLNKGDCASCALTKTSPRP